MSVPPPAKGVVFCPLDGERCESTPDPDDDMVVVAVCPAGHRWSMSVDTEADTPDGWAVFGFQCDNNTDP